MFLGTPEWEFPFIDKISWVSKRFFHNKRDSLHLGIQVISHLIQCFYRRIFTDFWDLNVETKDLIKVWRKGKYDLNGTQIGNHTEKVKNGTCDWDDKVSGMYVNKKKLSINILFSWFKLLKNVESKIHKAKILAIIYLQKLIMKCISKLDRNCASIIELYNYMDEYDKDRIIIINMIDTMYRNIYIPYVGVLCSSAYYQYIDHIQMYLCTFAHKNSIGQERSWVVTKDAFKNKNNNRNDRWFANKLQCIRHKKSILAKYGIKMVQKKQIETVPLWDDKIQRDYDAKIAKMTIQKRDILKIIEKENWVDLSDDFVEIAGEKEPDE